MKLSTALKLVHDELERAQENHPSPMHDPHHGYAILLEEIDELWAEIKASQGTTHRGVSEAVQVAAMAVRYLVDLCPDETAKEHTHKAEVHKVQRYEGERGGYSG